jgi:hypothetical protein
MFLFVPDDSDCCASFNRGGCAAGYKFFALSGDSPGRGRCPLRTTCCVLETVGAPPRLVVTSQHGDAGSVSVPDVSYSAPSNRSFFALPRSLKVVQDVGGDGVDTDLGMYVSYVIDMLYFIDMFRHA